MQVYAAVALIINDAGEILAISRRNRPNDLGLIGGKLNEGETPIQAVIREVKEEVGLSINDYNCILLHSDDVSKSIIPEYVNCYYISNWTGAPKAQETGFIIKWIDWENLCNPHNSFYKFNQDVRQAYLEDIYYADGWNEYPE